MKLQRHEEALAAFEHAIRLNPNLAVAYTNKVEMLFALKRYEEVFTTIEQSLQHNPKNTVMYIYKGNVLLVLKRYGEALAAFEHAILLDPKFALYASMLNLRNIEPRKRTNSRSQGGSRQALFRKSSLEAYSL
jgi:tetratricopeptide (TPR) repeat protein